MNHRRIVRVVVAITALYLGSLIAWTWLIRDTTPPETVSWQIIGFVAGYGTVLGLGMLWAQRPSRADRRILREGLEGWATIAGIQQSDTTGFVILSLEVTVPGWEPYSGTMKFALPTGEEALYAPGETIPVIADPRNRDRLILRPPL